MRKIRFASLWMAFAAITFFILLATALIMSVLAVFLFRLGYFSAHRGGPLVPILFLLILSAIVGASMFLLVGRIFIRPIRQLSEAAKEVAKGNFMISIEENNRIQEVTELASNFNLMVHELSGIETLRTDFVTNVSHEFKTPLSAIEGYATLLQDNNASDNERMEYTHMIIDSTKQLSTLAENILSLSRLENQEDLLDKVEFRLDEQIRESILLFESKWTEKVSYIGSKNLLKQVWINLLDNAIKFTPEYGQVEVSLSIQGNEISISIKDTGRGIEPAEISHIFDKFYQSDKARKEAGNGLGLALVKRIVDLSGGTIIVQSQSITGSEFTVRLPK
jgi:signal transduction histidine kinase